MNPKAGILVVDDTPANLTLLEDILSREGYSVRVLADGALAVRSALSHPPDLILLDIKMPETDGYQVCTQLKADARTREIPVIFISALTETADKIKAFEAGGVDYIPKPFHAEEVLARVATHLNLQWLQQALRTNNAQLRSLLDEQLRSRRQLEEAAVVFEVSNEGIMLTDTQGVIQRVNPAFTHITGYPADAVIGRTPGILRSGHHKPEFYAALWRTLAAHGYWEGEIWNRHQDGSIYPKWEMISAVRDSEGTVTGYVAQFSDITRRKLTEAEIRHYGNYDALTGMASRALLLERLEQAIKEHRRTRLKLGLMYIDLERFKQVNDALGHIIGDFLLQQVGQRIQQEIRDTDTAARLGSDEFVVMLTGLPDQAPSKRVAARLLESLGTSFELEGREVRINASIGIAIFPDDGDNVEALCRNADLAMSRAKDSGHHQAKFFTEAMEKEFLERSRLETDLRLALERDELRLYYQPIMDLQTGRISGLEALLRWHHPVLGVVSPARFITIAEETGLIIPIGTWVLETVCRQLKQWQERDLYVSVNVSVHQIPHSVSPAWLLEQMAGTPPHRLVLEITESVFIKDLDTVARWLHSLREAGFRIYLDDFGTGYSSLSYLKRFPVDALKVDQVFVREMGHQGRDQALVRAIVAMSEGLGLQVVAEGIETREQLEILRTFNCPYGQGFLFSKPVFGEALDKLLEAV